MNGVPSASDHNEVALIAEELSRAVEITLNPTVAHDARSQAYNACESFKENSPWCAQAGLLLANSGQYSAVVKHFGLQLMEHTVKYRWTQITQAEKIFIKENSMKLLYMGGWDVAHLNDALARVVVEMIKREWPQQWPALLSELSDACAAGHAQTQIVLHIFLRLVEDVATLQTLEQNRRRKDIYQALTGHMAEIFAFFLRLTEQHVTEYRERSAAGDYAAAESHGRVVQVVLLTLTGFVEWVSIQHVVMSEGRLLHVLCVLLQGDFRLPAAECLLQVVNRRGSTKERKPLLILFNEEAVACVHRAALAAAAPLDEKHYLFLKKLSQVIVGLAQQLASLWAHAGATDAWLPLLLEAALALLWHPSLTLAQAGTVAWLALLRHEQASRAPAVLAAVPRWLQAAAPKVLKVSYPAARAGGVHDVLACACLDYDSEAEFNMFFNRCRVEILEGFKHCMTAAPLITWSFVEQWATTALDKAEGPACPAAPAPDHPLCIEWEALAMVLDVTLSRLPHCSPRPPLPEMLRLLDRCARAEPPPRLLSPLLSFVSALAVVLSCCGGPDKSVAAAGAELLPRVLDKVFAALVLPGAGEDAKTVRRHAAGLLVKLASKYPLVLLPVFPRLAAARAALPPPGAHSVALLEALLLVANHFCCYARQAALVAEILGDTCARWEQLAPHVGSAAGLARLLALDAATAADGGAARRALAHALAVLLGVVRRSCVPDDPDKASRGGFGGGVTPAGNPIWRNPCAAHVLPLLPHVLALCRSLHALHAPDAARLRHAGHARALQLPPAERNNLLVLRDADAAPRSEADRVQSLLHTLHDNVCHLIGAAASTLGRELYSVPGLAAALAGSLCHGLQHLPDHWLRPIVRSALKPLIHHCPPAHLADVVLPLMESFAPFMLAHLTARWDYISELISAGKLQEEGADTQEVLEDVLVRNLTRDYIELLKIALVGGPLSAEAGAHDMDEDAPAPAPRAPDHASECGALLLASDAAQPLLYTIYRALSWNDSTTSLRACGLLQAAALGARDRGRLPPGDAAAALAALLHALRVHGQHDANQAAVLAQAVQLYEALRPQYPGVAAVLLSIPDVDAAELQRLDDKLCSAKPKQDKSKRDLFKKITQRLIGRNVGQLFKKEVFIRDLPSMPPAHKEAAPAAVDAPGGAALAQLFQQ